MTSGSGHNLETKKKCTQIIFVLFYLLIAIVQLPITMVSIPDCVPCLRAGRDELPAGTITTCA